jgi:DNA helicase-2/ATP-dependent DNA helicase PcrA
MVAGAGSGKTTSLVKALDHLRRTRGERLRRRGQRVACITYTEIAAREIEADVGDEQLFHVSTIHSFLWTVIRPFQEDIRAWVERRLHEKLEERQEKLNRPTTKATTRQRAEQDVARYRSQLTALPRVPSFTYGTGSDYAKGVLGHSDILQMVPQILKEKTLLQTIMARRFPFVFVDESQDTDPTFVNALKAVDRQEKGAFCVGFFGDPMQQIYSVGIGAVAAEADWESITKRENFRCPRAVLAVINRIRAKGDDVQQERGRTVRKGGADVPVEGTARFYVLPADDRRAERIHALRAPLREQHDEPKPVTDDDNLRVLVLVHRMAARRLGFGDLFAAMYDNAPDSLKIGFVEGTAWPLRPFLSSLLPLASAFEKGEDFEVMNLLRKYCPLLEEGTLQDGRLAERLVILKNAVTRLHALLRSTDSSIRDVLQHVLASKLVSLDERLDIYVQRPGENDEDNSLDDEEQEEAAAMRKYLACSATQTWGYREYVENASPFATQQGVKGAEFERVIVVLDDDEGKEHNQFSYEKYFGVKPLSYTDRKNQAEGKDTVLDRTRRLFYVCCSRALHDLVVVWFANDVDKAVEAVRRTGIFEPGSVKIDV